MLPHSRRLRAQEVVEVLEHGHSLPRGVYLSAKAVPLPEDGTMRFAAVLSKKIAKTAIVRNRTRRALYRAVDRYFKNYSEGGRGARVVLFIHRIPEDPPVAFAADLKRLFPPRGIPS